MQHTYGPNCNECEGYCLIKRTWITQARPDTEAHLTDKDAAILAQIATESRDQNARIYTQAEILRAMELVRAEAARD